MPGVILNMEVIDRTPIRLLKREISKLRKEALQELAEWFLRTKVPAHFGPANRRRFNHQPRNPVYSREIKRLRGRGQGKFVDNVLTGKSKRQALAFARITATGNKATLRLRLPTYFSRPFVGSFVDEDGFRRTVTRQPDKVEELLTLDARDRDELRKRMTKLLRQKLRAIKNQRRTKIAA